MKLPRTSGVLLHPTCLPGPHGSGDLGAAAYHFVDWLAGAGQKLWQILPLGGVGPGNSPYMSSSAFAGNLLLIDLAELQQRGWLDAADLQPEAAFSNERVNFGAVVPWRRARLERAAQRFAETASVPERADLAAFQSAQADWLADYALFMTLADANDWRDWNEWPAALAQREPAALHAASAQYAARIAFWTFCQWCFFRQWLKLKAYANQRGVQVVGDAPIFIAYQSAEVWARQDLFELDRHGQALVVAGVPPDYFSATGQRWGNPLYRWSAHADEGYAWWIQRVRRTFELVDIVRIDHFRGFSAYWEIPANEPTAVLGRWVLGPGAALFEAIHAALGALPIIAEDLGIITLDVEALRQQFDLPGMRVLHFAFGGANDNAYLPHNHDANTVVYTGTHDNNTTQGWWAQTSDLERQHVRDYLALKTEDEADIHWELIRASCASVADTVIHPMQDVLGLGPECRMNLPGVGEGYWEWRFSWSQVKPGHAQQLLKLCQLYGRS
ncbi:MAG: 4-alpha-glucanotransferase [Pseudomonadota bacterium]